MKLLTVGNPKTIKGQKAGFLSFILHLAPSTLSGFNTCPMASNGCKAACLNTAGRGGMFKKGETTNAIQEARVRKTRLFFEDRAAFMDQLEKDIRAGIKMAGRKGFIPVFRLNGTSDIRWETVPTSSTPNIMALFPDIQFYDYTKIVNRRDIPTNYHLTFSLSESNDTAAQDMLARGFNVAAVFKSLPATFMGYPVIDGDETDLRFLDPNGAIVGLKAKGRAKKDVSGFVR